MTDSRRFLIAVLPVLALLAAPASAAALTQVSVQSVAGVGNVVVVNDDDSSAELVRDRELDPAFGAGGIVVTDFGTGEDSARAVAVRDGRILVAGSIYSSQGLARYLP